MLHALVTFAATEGEESSKTLFYVMGSVLVVWALAISAVGIARPETFPSTPGAARAMMAISVLLVLATMASAVITG